ncbi:MAG: hypothetical protein ACM3ZE_05160, partial [Myxococcales bacterium]
TEEEGDQPLPQDLPFAVTVGFAVAHPNGYAVTAVDARPGGSHSVLALLDKDVSRGTILDLGRVYGDAEPPRVVIRGEEGFVVVPDTDASGHSYRYGWVRGLNSSPRVDWLGSFEQSVDESPVYGLASTPETITFAWDELDRASRISRVRWASFDTSGRPIVISTKSPLGSNKPSHEPKWTIHTTEQGVDAESPELVSHGAGYWLSFLASETEKPRPAAGGTTPKVADAKDDDVRAIDLGRRGIWLVPLDMRGVQSGKPIVITSRGARVISYDLAVTSDGGAVVAYRDADATPGVEEQVIEVVRVRPDGGLVRHRIDDERVGAGTPSLLVDYEVDNGARSVWISVAGSSGETKLAELATGSAPTLDIVEEPSLAGAEPMLRRGNALLVARHRARLVGFERTDCTWPDAQTGAPKLP